MSVELWGSRVELKWVMNRAIFSGDHNCRCMKGSGQKVLERHTGKGHRVAQGGQHSFTAGSAQKGRHFAVCRTVLILCLLLRAPLDHPCP